jgi:hypothetical protein
MDSLRNRIATLERKLGTRPTAARQGRTTLAGEIASLERRLGAMSYMDDELDSMGDDVVVGDTLEVGMGDELDPMDEVGMSDDLGLDDVDDDPMDEDLDLDEVDMDEDLDLDEVGMDEVGMDEVGMDEDLDLDEDFCTGPKFGSETKPGVEDEITQDYLSEAEGEAHGDEMTTDDSMIDAAPTGHVASREYASRLKRASARLDRVAEYLEANGRKPLARRIDRISDAIDARSKKALRRA